MFATLLYRNRWRKPGLQYLVCASILKYARPALVSTPSPLKKNFSPTNLGMVSFCYHKANS